MKILMVINTLYKGGKERRMLELIKELKNRNEGYEIYLVSLTDVVHFPYVYDLPITFEIISKKKGKKDFSLIFKLRKIIKNFKPDIIHSWDMTASGYLSFSNMFTGIPLLHGIIYDASAKLNPFNRSLYRRIRLLTPFGKVFIANSKAGLRSYNIPEKKAVCIYNGIDFNRFRNLKPAEQVALDILGEAKGNKHIVAMVAIFAVRKDHDTLIKAAIELCSRNPDIYFLLVGHGEFEEPTKEKVPGPLLNNQIRFLGSRQDIEDILQIIDTGVLITNAENHGEGISNSIVEYMASKKPVIATTGGGTNEIVIDGENGFLIEHGNVNQLVEKVLALKNDRQLAERMGTKAHECVFEKFNIEKVTQTYIELYRKYHN